MGNELLVERLFSKVPTTWGLGGLKLPWDFDKASSDFCQHFVTAK